MEARKVQRVIQRLWPLRMIIGGAFIDLAFKWNSTALVVFGCLMMWSAAYDWGRKPWED